MVLGKRTDRVLPGRSTSCSPSAAASASTADWGSPPDGPADADGPADGVAEARRLPAVPSAVATATAWADSMRRWMSSGCMVMVGVKVW